MTGFLDGIERAIGELGRALDARYHRRVEAWTRIAARRGGTCTATPGGLFSAGNAELDVIVSDAAVHVDTYTVRGKNHTRTYTRVRSAYVLPVGPIFRLHPENFLSSIATTFGFEDALVGRVPGFDESFVVRTAAPDATRAALGEELQARMVGVLRDCNLESDGHRVMLVLPGAVSDARALEAAIDVTGGVAAYGMSWLAALRTVPGAIWVPPSGAWDRRTTPAARVDLEGSTVWLFATLAETALTFAAACETRRALETFTSEVGAGGVLSVAPPDGVLGAETLALLPRAAPGTLAHDGRHARFVLHGELGSERVYAAARLVAHVAAGSTRRGVFR